MEEKTVFTFPASLPGTLRVNAGCDNALIPEWVSKAQKNIDNRMKDRMKEHFRNHVTYVPGFIFDPGASLPLIAALGDSETVTLIRRENGKDFSAMIVKDDCDGYEIKELKLTEFLVWLKENKPEVLQSAGIG